MSLIHRLLQFLLGQAARVVCAVPILILLLGTILATGSVYVVITRFNVINNTSDLLSNASVPKQNFNQLLKEFGSDARFIVLIQSPDINKNRHAADAVGAYLESLRPQISTVLYKIDYSALKERLLFTRDIPELEKIANDIEAQVNQQKASERSTEQIALDLNSILDEANRKFDDKYLRKTDNWKDFAPFVDRFVNILNRISDQATAKPHAAATDAGDPNDPLDNIDADELLAQHEYFTLQEGKSVLVFAYTGEAEKNSETPFSKTVEKIRAYFKTLEAKPEFAGVSFKLSGEPVLDADQIAASNEDAMKASGITLALILTLFIFSYRTIVRPAVTFFVLIMAVLWSLGFALLTVGHFNVLSVAVIPMVLGIGIDFGIQMLGRYEEELGLGRSVQEAVTIAMRHTGVALVTGGSTTAVAFFTLCFNDFVGLSELGVIAGSSMVLCILANLLVLPSIFVLWDRHRSPDKLRTQSSNSAWNFIHSWDRNLTRTPRLWLMVSLVISLAAALSLPRLKFDYNLLHLQNQQADSVRNLYALMDASREQDGKELSTIYASVVTNNLEDARIMADKLKSLPPVAKIDSVLDIIPQDQDKKLPIIKRIVAAGAQIQVKPSPTREVDIPRARKDTANLLALAKNALQQAKGYQNISKIAKQAVLSFGAMIPALERSNRALNSASVDVLQQRFSTSTSGAFNRLRKNIDLLNLQKADRGIGLQDVPPQLARQFVSPNGKILLEVYGKKDLWERAPDVEFSEAVLSVAPQATGTPILNYYATELLRVSYLWASVWAFVAIVVLILLHFQSILYLILTLMPLVLAVLWRTGAMVWFNIDFNPANIVTLPLIIGIDVAFGVYIVDRFREDGRFRIFSESTGKAIIMSALTSFFGFASLLISQFRGMYSIGVLMSLGLAIGLVTAVFVLPQLLVLIQPKEKDETSPHP